MDKKEYATWNYPLWVDNDYILYQAKMEYLKAVKPMTPAMVKVFLYKMIGPVSPDGARLVDVDLAAVASDWDEERKEATADDS